RPDSRELATLGEDQIVRFYDPATGRLLRLWAGPIDPVLASIAYDRHGRLLVGRADGKISFDDPETGAVLEMIDAHAGLVNDADVGKDGTLFASTGSDKTSAIWELPGGKLRWRQAHA